MKQALIRWCERFLVTQGYRVIPASSDLWDAAAVAVRTVKNSPAIQRAAANESMYSFCPRCGQIPDGDRRMEEARELTMQALAGKTVKRAELDLAISFEYWRQK